MTFAHPELLWLFTIFPGVALWVIGGRRRRNRAWQALAQRGRPPRDGTGFLLACSALLIVALAQPRWGRLAAPPPPPGHDVVLLIDVSKSMGVEDAVPNRLAVAVEAAESMVRALVGDAANRAAVVAFAGRGVIRCPLTENLGAVLDALHRLRPGVVRPGGTDLGSALDAARDALGPEEHAAGRAIVVFSDGEDLVDHWSERLERLRREDIIVHAIAIGDPDQGHPVPDGTSAQLLRYHGEPVLSRRSDRALEAIALRTDGAFLRLGLASVDLGTLYQTKIEPGARRRRESTRIAERAERFPLFLMAALSLLVAGCWPPTRGWPWPWPWRRLVRTTAVAATGLTLVGLTTGAGDAPAPAGPESAAQAIARGQVAYDLRQWDQALAAFESAIKLAPNSGVPRYDAAAALFQLGRYAEARQYYREARERSDPTLSTKIDFALGNTALAEGDIAGAIKSYDECMASTAPGLALDRVRGDAAANRQFALAQPQSLTVPPDDSSSDPSKSRKPDRRKSPDRQRPGDTQPPGGEPEAEPGNGGAGNEGQDEQDRKPKGRRRTGGADGGANSPPGTKGDTPDDRLDTALEHIRDAQKRRLPDEDPPTAATDDRKDW